MSKKIKEIIIIWSDDTEEKLYPEHIVKTGPTVAADDDPIGGDGGGNNPPPPKDP